MVNQCPLGTAAGAGRADQADPWSAPQEEGDGVVPKPNFEKWNWTDPDGLRERLVPLGDPRHARGIRHNWDSIILMPAPPYWPGRRTSSKVAMYPSPTLLTTIFAISARGTECRAKQPAADAVDDARDGVRVAVARDAQERRRCDRLHIGRREGRCRGSQHQRLQNPALRLATGPGRIREGSGSSSTIPFRGVAGHS